MVWYEVSPKTAVRCLCVSAALFFGNQVYIHSHASTPYTPPIADDYVTIGTGLLFAGSLGLVARMKE